MLAAAPALLFSVPMVQVFINSGTSPDAAVQILPCQKYWPPQLAQAFEGHVAFGFTLDWQSWRVYCWL